MNPQSVFSKLTSLSLGLQNSDGTFRIYPNYQLMGDKVYPSLIYQLDDFQPDYSFDGSDGVPTYTMKLTAVGQTYDSADALAANLVTDLDGNKGVWGSTQVLGCFLDDVSEEHFVDVDMQSILEFTKSLDFKVTYNANLIL